MTPVVTANNDTVSAVEDTLATGNVLANDTDSGGNPLHVSSFVVAGVGGSFTAGQTATIPGVGTLIINANGTYTFTPVLNYNGAVPVATYTAEDGVGGSDTATLTIGPVSAVNDAPVDGNESNTVLTNVTLSVNAAGGLLANSTDVDGGALSITTYTIAGISGNQTVGTPVVISGIGTVTINSNGSYSFTPATDYSGPIPVITYTVSDGAGGTDTSTLSLAMGSIGGPTANIMTDAETLPTTYNDNNYFLFATDLKSYRGYAPHSVYLSGWNTTPFEEIATWSWDFGAGTEGDYGGRYFEGINAAHVFESAGEYTVTLTVTDYLGRSSNATRVIKVYQSGVGYNSIASYGSSDVIGSFYGTSYPLNTYYVDAILGNDTYDGKSQTYIGGVNGPWQTFEKVIAMMRKTLGSAISTWPLKPGDKVLLKKGQTFPLVGTWDVFGHGGMSQGIHIGVYGTGANPIVQNAMTTSPNANGGIFSAIGVGIGFVAFNDIDFNLRNGAIYNLAGVWSSISANRNITFLRCKFINPINVSVSGGEPASTRLTTECYGFFILGNTATGYDNADASVVLFLYGSPAAFAIIGNTADMAGNHINYLNSPYSSIISDNVFSRPAFGRTALRITGGGLNAPSAMIHITRNKFLGWVDPISNPSGSHNGGGTRYNGLLLQLADNGSPNEYGENVVVDRNVFTNFELSTLVVNYKNVSIKNNLYVSPSPLVGASITLGATDINQMRPLDNIKILNNTFVYNGAYNNTSVPFISMVGTSGTGPYHTAMEFSNNAAISISGRQDEFISISEDLAGQFDQITATGNLLDSPDTKWGKFLSNFYTLENWKANFHKDIASFKATAGVVTPPTVISHAPGFPDSLAAGLAEVDSYIAALHLTAGSAAENTGNSNVPVYRDYSNSPRPIYGKDIGAFERSMSQFIPINIIVPTITGNAYVGTLLTVANGTWNADPVISGYTYSWISGANTIVGTNNSYTAQVADIGNTLRCEVTAINTQGSATSSTISTSSVNYPPAGGQTITDSTFGSVAFGEVVAPIISQVGDNTFGVTPFGEVVF